MAGSQIKSRARVQEHGEVFTAEREVKAMCDLVKDETYRIDSRILEPACGDGNFLTEILTRKLETVRKRYTKVPAEWEKYSLLALSSLYGIDIMQDNVESCRERLFTIWEEAHQSAVGDDTIEGIHESASYLLKTNILCGDALSLRKSDQHPIVFAEWNLIGDEMMKRRDFELATMLEVQSNGGQGDLFLSSDTYDQEMGAYVPKPVKEYPPIAYWRLPCLQ